MTTWDIMHVKSLEVEHSVPESEVLAALKDGRLSRDDCARRAGREEWLHFYELSEFREALMQKPVPSRGPQTRVLEAGTELLGGDVPRVEGGSTELVEGDAPRVDGGSLRDLLSEVEPVEAAPRPKPRPGSPPLPPMPRITAPAKPAAPQQRPKPGPSLKPDWELPVPVGPAEDSEPLPYAKRKHEEPEELDMTPMVDVAMQLILFFMVTSTMIMQSALGFPKPAPDERAQAKRDVIQPLEDMKIDNIMVKVKADNSIWVDEDKALTKESDLLARLERARRDKPINHGVVISAEDAAYHQSVVAVIDAANVAEIKPIKMAAPKKTDKKKTATKKRTIKD